jgi:hypothetical protein
VLTLCYSDGPAGRCREAVKVGGQTREAVDAWRQEYEVVMVRSGGGGDSNAISSATATHKLSSTYEHTRCHHVSSYDIGLYTATCRVYYVR